MPGEPAPPSRRRAAAECFGLPPDADPAMIRAALLHRLGEADFLIEPIEHEAALVLLDRPAGTSPLLAERRTVTSQTLHRQVDAFAADFFDLPPAARRERCGELFQAAAGDPRAQVRLRRLEAGLHVVPESLSAASPLVRRMADDLLELFVIAPEAQPAASREKVWLLYQDPEITSREHTRARRELTRRHPQVAALSPGYLAELARPRRSPGSNQRRAWVSSLLRRDLSNWRFFTKSAGPWLLVLFLVNVIRIVATDRSPTKATPSPVILPVSPAIPNGFASPPGLPAPGRSPALSPQNSAWFAGLLRSQFRAKLGPALAGVGMTLREEELNQIVAEVPFEEDAAAGNQLVTSIRLGVLSPREVGVIAGAVDRGLQRAGKALPRDRVDQAIRNALEDLAPGRPSFDEQGRPTGVPDHL